MNREREGVTFRLSRKPEDLPEDLMPLLASASGNR